MSKIQDTSKKARTIDKKQQQGDDDNYETKKQIAAATATSTSTSDSSINSVTKEGDIVHPNNITREEE